MFFALLGTTSLRGTFSLSIEVDVVAGTVPAPHNLAGSRPAFFAKLRRMTHSRRCLLYVALICLASLSFAQQKASSASVTGRYEGTAKDKAENVITVAFDLTEKEGALTGTINSSHGDFAITGGTHKGDAVTLEFDANGAAGTISLHMTEDKLVGTWTAGDDGGPVDVKKAAPQAGAAKGKS